MNNASAFDEVAESFTVADNTQLPSPLAEVQAQALPPVMPLEQHAATVVEAAPVVAVPAAAVAVTTASQPVASSLGTASALGTMPSSTAATLPMLGALLLVVALILGLGKLVKRVQQARSGQGAALAIKGGVQVGAKERVVWMQAGDTHLLLGVSPGHVQTLHVFDVAPDFMASAAREPAAAAAPAAGDSPASRDFSERLKTLLAHARAKGIDTEPAEAVAQQPVVAAAAVKAAEPMRAATSKAQFSFRA
ncbi:MAG: flagellar biosynthetic protein FliO [Pseudomonadota bacterium]